MGVYRRRGDDVSNSTGGFGRGLSSWTAIIDSLKGIDIMDIMGNQLLFGFNHTLDLSWVIEGCPWKFDKNLFILSLVEIENNLLRVELNWCPFVATLIGNKLGTFARYCEQLYGEGYTALGTEMQYSPWLQVTVSKDPFRQYLGDTRLSDKSMSDGVPGLLHEEWEQTAEVGYISLNLLATIMLPVGLGSVV
ncbi:hypothetical protein Salat_2701200 [Sesamum alatum]|uniref:DUF4283 domain-containing protein n=1 Tax=Sesamum alatum TaxID=300844 RepID=A0AAE2CBC5_9LAMI|nr:hypothetical protein Salat_2701200 [Sesamum alatum]